MRFRQQKNAHVRPEPAAHVSQEKVQPIERRTVRHSSLSGLGARQSWNREISDGFNRMRVVWKLSALRADVSAFCSAAVAQIDHAKEQRRILPCASPRLLPWPK